MGRKRSKVPFRRRLSVSWSLTKQVFGLLGRERDLWLFPLVSTAATTAGLAAWFIWMDPFGGGAVSGPLTSPVVYLQLFFLLLPVGFLAALLNAALAFGVYERLEGRTCSLGDAMARSLSLSGVLFAYSVIGTVVGLLFAALGEALEKLRVVPWLGGLIHAVGMVAWVAATYFVVPIIVVERERSAVGAIRRSAGIVRERWGEAAGGGMMVVGLALTVAMLPLLVVFLIVLSFAAAGMGGAGFTTVALAAFLAWGAVLFALMTALHTAYQTALYRYVRADGDVGMFKVRTGAESAAPGGGV